MTTFDEKCLRIGILADPAFFEGADAWRADWTSTGESLSLVESWTTRFAPILAPPFPSGFDHACVRHFAEVARRARGERAGGLVLATSAWPQGTLALGAWSSLVRLLSEAHELVYPTIKPIDYLTSLHVDEDDDPDSLAYLNEPPDERDHAEVRRLLGALEGLAEQLDGHRAWAVYAGDDHDAWSASSRLSEYHQRRSAPAAPARRAEALEEPSEPDEPEDFGSEDFGSTATPYYSWPECPDCGEPRDPELEYCWTCQCT